MHPLHFLCKRFPGEALRPALFLVFCGFLLAGCDLFGSEDEPEVQIEELVVGTGDKAERGMTVNVWYTLWLADGTWMDSNVGEELFPLTLGSGGVIPGFDQGIRGMREGGRRKVTVPPELGYGNRPWNGIPANSTLVFEIVLEEIVEPAS